MVSVNVEPKQASRKRDKLKHKLQHAFSAKTSYEDSETLDLKVKIDNVEQTLSRSCANMGSWDECVPL